MFDRMFGSARKGELLKQRLRKAAFRRRERLFNSLTRRACFETLEDRRLLAVFSEAGSFLNIDLAANEQLSVVNSGNSYLLSLSSTNWSGTNTTNATGNGSPSLLVTGTGLVVFDTINVTDSGAGVSVTFLDSGINSYSDSFNVLLDDADADSIVFLGTNRFVGTASVNASTTLDIRLSDVGSLRGELSTVDGGITLRANVSGTTGVFIGLEVNNSVIASSGTGNISIVASGGVGTGAGVVLQDGHVASAVGTVTIEGKGGNGRSFNSGVVFRGSGTGSTITSAAGDISITGTGGGSEDGLSNHGVSVSSGGQIIAGGNGSVTVTGIGGNLNGNGGNNNGVEVTSAGSIISSAGGNVTVIGTGGGSGEGAFNEGVSVDFFGQISAGGNGTVTVVGQGGNLTGDGGANHGVSVGLDSTIMSSGGNVSVTGAGGGSGGSSSNFGIVIGNNGRVTAGGIGTVTVVGSGGNLTSAGTSGEGNNDGVILSSDGSITSNGGHVSVNGTGGGAGTTIENIGVNLISGSITAGGNGTVTVVGNGGNRTGTGFGNYGVSLSPRSNSLPVLITSNGGDVSVTGTGGGAGSSNENVGVRLIDFTGQFNVVTRGNVSITAGGNGSVTVVGHGGNPTGTGDQNIGILVSGEGSTIASGGTSSSGAITLGGDSIVLTGSLGNTVSASSVTAAGNLTINVDDDFTVSSGVSVSALGTLTINVDQAPDLDVGTGSTVVLDGVLTGGSGVFLNGGVDSDTLIVDSMGAKASFTNSAIRTTAGSLVNLASVDNIVFVGQSAVEYLGSSGSDTLTWIANPSPERTATIHVLGGPSVTYDRFSSALDILAGDGDDTLTVDVSNVDSLTNINFVGGPNLSTNQGDQLLITGTPLFPFDQFTFNYANANDGSIDIDGFIQIQYTGLEPITSSITAANVTLNYSANDETIAVTQSSNNVTVDSTVGSVTTFVSPTENLTINTGGGTDLVTVNGLTATLSGAFSVNDASLPVDDTVQFITNPSRVITGRVDIAALNIDINTNLNVDGDMRLGRGTNTGVIRTNIATITSLGEVVFDERLNVLGTTEIMTDNDSGVTFHFPVDGPAGLTVTGGTAVDFLQVNGSVTPLANLTVTATAGSIRLDDVTTTGPQNYNSPVVTGSGGGTVELIGGSVSFASTVESGAGSSEDLVIDVGGTVSLGGTIGQSSPFGIVDITSPQGLSVDQSISANSIFLSTVDAATAGQNVIVTGTARLDAPTEILIDAGDDVTIASGVTITTGTFDIDADADPSNLDAVGASVSVLATVIASIGTTITTGANSDTFTILPQGGTAFTLLANDPSTSPGDTITIDGGGFDVTFDVASGAIIVPGAQPVTAIGMENLTLANIANLTVNGSSTFDLITVAGGAVAGTDRLTINGNAPISLVGITNLIINGLGGDDFFGYDTRTRAISAAVTFNGGLQDNTTGGDILRIDGSFTTQVLNYSAPGTDGNNGDLVLDGTTVTYTGLEPIVAGNSVDTILNFNTGVANNATLRDNPSAGVIEIVDNGSTFEDTQFPNPTNSLTINLGTGGDTLTVEALDAAYAASMIITSVLGLGNVQLNGVTISNTPGRGLDVVGVRTLGITNSTFSNNTADVGGGLRVVSAGANTTTTIDNSTFSNNVATGNAATQGGGAIFIDGGDLTVRNNTVISGNRATGVAGSGGGIHFATVSTLSILDSTISGNEANGDGGGIEIQQNGTVNLTNTTIQGNFAGFSGAPGNGGGLHTTLPSNVTITGGLFSGNTASAEGGGVWNALGGNLTITGGAVISGNFANGDLDPAGAFVDLQGGGGIFNDGGTVVINDVGGAVEISDNFATGTTFGSGGGILSNGGSVTITGARISNNATVRAGGGLEIVEGNVTLINSTIDANFAATQSPITANPGNGGGLHITGGATVTIDGGSITNNVAQAEGGGLWNSATGALTITGQNNAVLISGNVARGDAAPGAGGTDVQGGGGIFNNGGTLTLDGDRITKNINITGNAASGATNGSGGGVLTIGGTVNMTGVSIDGNEAVRAGGGLEIVTGNVFITQANIVNNDLSSADLLGLGIGVTAGNGGGLHITGAAIATIDGATISGNVAGSEGGGLWNSLTGTIVIRDIFDSVTISNNVAQGNADPAGNLASLQGGGGVFNNGGSLQFANQGTGNFITISGNAASGSNFGSGGGVLSIGGTVDFTAVEVNGNEAVRSGGGVELVDGTFTMFGGLITGNDVSAADLLGRGLGASPGNGGGLHVTGTATVTVTSVSITSNVAGREGGGLWNNTGSMTIFGATVIEDNVARGDAADDGGGGIFNNGGTLVVASSAGGSPTIANNIASGLLGSGGGIFNGVGGTLQVTNVTISNNVANRAGGGIEDASGAGFTLILDSVTMADNNAGVSPAVGAPGNGGGLHVTGAANVRISGGTYSGNSAASEGGALWNGTGTMTIELGTMVDGNTASGDAADDGGGGIFNNGGTLRLTDGLIVVSNNIANGTLGSGGGIFNNTGGTVFINGSTISGNRANRAGGGIEDASGAGFGITFTGGLLTDNLAGISPAVPSPGIGGGLNVTGGSNVTLDGTRVAGNIAATEGGGLNNGTGTMTILNGAIIETNESRGNNSGDGGGGIFNDQGTLIVQGVNTAIQNNRATGLFGIGGGIASRRGSVSITDATLINNRANSDGGGIIVRGPGATVSLLRASILDNTAEDSGGGAFFSGATVTVTDSIVTGNVALGTATLDGIGGGLFLGGDDTSSDFLIGNTTFSSNAADGAGGGVYVLDASGTITGSGLLSNRVTGAGTSFDQGGGGIAIVAANFLANVSITDSSISNNQSPAAAGMAIVDASVTVSNSTISDNVAGAVGAGGIGVVASVPLVGNALELINSRVRNNSTTGEGGGLGVVNASILIDSSTIETNQATGGRGGGIGAIGQGSNETVTLRASTLFANTSSLSGGGVALQNMGLDFENVTLSGNSAGTTGGGLAYDNSNNTLTRRIQFTTFASNLATNGGANIAGIGTSPIDVRATIIADGSVAAIGMLNSLGNNLDSGNTSGFNQPTDLLNTDPMLGPLADNGGPVFTHAISFGSPAIDGGGSIGPSTDARGFSRPNDGNGDGIANFDIGAAEGEEVSSLVVDNISDVDDGDTTPGNLTLREAVRLSNSNPGTQTITFGGLFADATPDRITLSGTALRLTDSVTIIGPGASLLTIDANNLSGIFDIDDLLGPPTVVLSDMTLTRGRNSVGGAIFNDGNLTILDSLITGNRATGTGSDGRGGAIYSSGPLAITRSTLSNNIAEVDGGAIFASENVTITESTISGNSANDSGGGLAFSPTNYTTPRTASILRSSILNNSADIGAGLFNGGDEGLLAVIESTISGNTATTLAGGILSYSGGNVDLVNSTVSGNVGGAGSGLTIGYSSSDTASILNSTIVGNSGGDYGVYIGDVSRVVITNSIIAGNTIDGSANTSDLNDTASSGALDLANSFSNLIGNPNTAGGLTHGTNGNILGNGAGAVLPLSSILNPVLGNNGGPTLTHALVSGSPAIDAGNAGLAPATDQRGIARPADGDNNGSAIPDIGAFEASDFASLSIADVTINEGVGTATVTVSLNIAVPGGFTVNFATANGTATSPGDYTPANGTLTFAGTVGELQTFTVSIIDDLIAELAETINVSLNTPSNSMVSVADTGVVNILDDDIARLSVVNTIRNENLGTLTFTITLNGSVDSNVDVDIETIDIPSQAIGGIDYQPESRRLTFDGSSGATQTFTVTIIDDSIVEPDENVGVVLRNLNANGRNVQIENPLAVTFTERGRGGTSGFGDVQIIGNLAYASNIDGLFIFDISNPAQITLLGTIDNIDLGFDVDVIGNLAYIAGDRSGLHIIDVTDPRNPVQIGIFDAIDNAEEVEIVGNRAYVADGPDGLRIFDISNPANIQLLASFDTAGEALGLDVVGANVFIADFDRGLIVLEVSENPISIRQVGSFNGSTAAVSVLIDGTRAYLSNQSQTSGFQVIDITNLNAPGLLGQQSLSDRASITQLMGTTAFITDGLFGIRAIDVSDPANLRQIGSFNPNAGVVSSLDIVGNQAFIASPVGLIAVDLAFSAAAVGTILNDDTANLTVADVTVNEDAGTATVTVVVNNAVQGGFTVNFATNNGTATNPSDYTPASGTLTFAGTADETRTFTVAIVDDGAIEATETINVVLSNPSVSTVNASDTAVINITDNDTNQDADVSVSLVGAPAAVQVNGTVIYTVVVSNSGPAAATNVMSRTTLPAGVTIQNVSATGGSVTSSAGVVTVDIGALNAGPSVTIDITAIVGSTPGMITVSSSVTSAADPVTSNDVASTSTNVIAQATTDLSLTSTSGSRFFSGSTGQVNFFVRNLSTSDATNVVTLFTLDPNVTFVSGAASLGTVTFLPTSNQVRVQQPSIAANTSDFISLTVSARNNLPNGTTLTTVGTVSSTETDSNPNDNSVTSTTAVTSARTLSTGADDGGVFLTVDVFGSMGSSAFGGLSQFNPIGPIDAAETVFEAGVLLGQTPGSRRQILTSGDFSGESGILPNEFTLLSDLAGTETRVTSSFMIGSLRFDLLQELMTTLDASGTVIGSALTQTYTVTNTASNATSFDLVRFLDGDLDFDGSISDSGGLRRTASGDEVLFVTETNLLPGADTTFVGVTATGGNVLADNRFQIEEFSSLESRVIAGSPLSGTIQGDLNGNGLVDAGSEYDVSLALRNFFQLAAGASTSYVTRTFFGSGPIENISNPPSSITGHVFCDIDGNGSEGPSEAQGGVTVFVDRNGNRVLDASELSTLTNLSGDYGFSNVPSGAVTVAVVVPEGCNTIPRNIGVARTSLEAGKLARSIASVDLDGDLDLDLVIASDLSNSVTVFENNDGAFSIRETVALSDRPQAISAWSPGSGSSESVVAVAGFGTTANKGTVFKIADGVTESFKTGDGPIAIVVDDFNGDSIADIVSVASRSSDLSLTLGRASTGSTSSTIGTSQVLAGVRNIRAVITGDFDGDGNVDIATAGLGYSADANSELKVLLGRGDGTFEAVIARAGDREVVDLVATDIDGDGSDELLTLSGLGQVKTYRLSSSVLSQIAQTSVTEGASSFAVGDLNGDQITDVAVANLGDEIIELLVGDRSGRFFVRSTVTNVTAPSDIVVADFDGDGRAEIAVANFYQQLPEIVTSETPRNRLPSSLTILKLNIAEQAVMVTSESTSTVNVTFPSANPATVLDVNRDSFVSAGDALAVISVMRQSDLAIHGNAESEQPTNRKGGKVVFRATKRDDADVNADGRVSALDALMVINHINQQHLSQILTAQGELIASPQSAIKVVNENDEIERKRRTQAIDALFAGGLF